MKTVLCQSGITMFFLVRAFTVDGAQQCLAQTLLIIPKYAATLKFHFNNTTRVSHTFYIETSLSS